MSSELRLRYVVKFSTIVGKFFAHEHAHGISASADHKVAVTCLSGVVYVLNENGNVMFMFI